MLRTVLRRIGGGGWGVCVYVKTIFSLKPQATARDNSMHDPIRGLSREEWDISTYSNRAPRSPAANTLRAERTDSWPFPLTLLTNRYLAMQPYSIGIISYFWKICELIHDRLVSQTEKSRHFPTAVAEVDRGTLAKSSAASFSFLKNLHLQLTNSSIEFDMIFIQSSEPA